MIGTLLFCAAVLFIFRSWLFQTSTSKRFRQEYGVDGTSPLPVLGDIVGVLWDGGLKGSLERGKRQHDTLGGVFLAWFLNRPVLSVADPALLRVIMGAKYPIYDRSPQEQYYFHDLLGGGLILESNGERWRAHRSILTNGFSQPRLSASLGDIGRRAYSFFSSLPRGERIDIQNLFQELTFDIMVHFSLGTELKELQDHDLEMSVSSLWYHLLDHMQSRFLFRLPYWRYLQTPGVKRAEKTLSFFREIILRAVEREKDSLARGEKEKSQKSLLSYMVEQHLDHENFTLDDIVQHAITFLFAGHDTTTNLLSFMFYHLGSDRTILGRAQAEVDALFAPHQDDPAYVPTLVELKGLHYLRKVVKETLRLYPGAPVRGRYALKDDCPSAAGVDYHPSPSSPAAGSLRPLLVPKGFSVGLNFYACHTNPEYWPDPFRFDPDRFDDEENANQAWFAFGGGPRRCIGEQFAIWEAVCITAIGLRRLVPLSDLDHPIVREITLTMRAKHGVMISFRPREDQPAQGP